MSDLRITPQHITLYLVQLLRSERLLHASVERLLPEHVRAAGGTPGQACVFKVIVQYYRQYGSAPDLAAIRVGLQQLADVGAVLDDDVFEEYQTLCVLSNGLVDARSEKLAWHVFTTIVNEQIKKPALQQEILQAAVSQLVSGLGQRLLDIERRLSVSEGGVARSRILTIDPRSTGDRLMLGIPWLDALLGQGAGMVRGSAAAIIAGQGHGKTAFGIQMAVAQAMQHRHALLILAEEGMSRQIRRRLMACTTGIPTTELERHDHDVRTLEDFLSKHPQHAMLKQKMAAVQEYLHVADFVEHPGGLDEIIHETHALRDRVKDVSYVYIDWAGPIADYMLAHGFRGLQLKSRYDALKLIGSEIAHLAQTTNTIVVISHQMASSIFKYGWRHEANNYCAMDCASFTERFKYAFVINPRDPKSGLCWFKIVKARDDPAGAKCIVRLRGELSQFVDVTKYYTYTHAGFKPLNDTDEQTMVVEA